MAKGDDRASRFAGPDEGFKITTPIKKTKPKVVMTDDAIEAVRGLSETSAVQEEMRQRSVVDVRRRRPPLADNLGLEVVVRPDLDVDLQRILYEYGETYERPIVRYAQAKTGIVRKTLAAYGILTSSIANIEAAALKLDELRLSLCPDIRVRGPRLGWPQIFCKLKEIPERGFLEVLHTKESRGTYAVQMHPSSIRYWAEQKRGRRLNAKQRKLALALEPSPEEGATPVKVRGRMLIWQREGSLQMWRFLT